MAFKTPGDLFILFGKYLNKLTHEFMKLHLTAQIMIWFIVVVFLYWFFGLHKAKEGFTAQYQGLSRQPSSFVQVEGINVYDDFYAEIFDEITYDEKRMDYEISEITRATNLNQKSRCLEVGCGTGRMVNALCEKDIPCDGIDVAPAMIQQGYKQFPHLQESGILSTMEEGDLSRIRVGNALETSLIPPYSMTHIFCMFYTIYYIPNRRVFFANAYEWLVDGGYLVVHMVNRNKFSTIMPSADPFLFVNPQDYAKERITESEIYFRDMSYHAKFDIRPKENKATLIETFKDPHHNKTRKQIQTLDMPTQRELVDMALEQGFTLKGKIDMSPCRYEHQYLYVFVKG